MKPFAALLLLIAAVAASCNILGPSSSPEPGSRDYTWSVDSVYSAPGGWLNAIWGDSPDNVWAVSGGGTDRIWHFDGSQWRPYSEQFPYGFVSVFGFADNNVWLGSDNGWILHFDGEEWQEFYRYQIDGMGQPLFNDIWGNSPNDVYAVGYIPTMGEEFSYRGFVLHYDGNNWQEVLLTDYRVNFHRIRSNRQHTLLYGTKVDLNIPSPDTLLVYHLTQANLQEIYKKLRNQAGATAINQINKSLYILSANNIYLYFNNELRDALPIADEFDVINFAGRNSNDLFIITNNGVAHFDGESFEKLISHNGPPTVVFRTLLFDKDIFFLVNDHINGTNLIYHGTLNE